MAMPDALAEAAGLTGVGPALLRVACLLHGQVHDAAQGDMLHRRTGDGQRAVMQAVDAAQLDLAHAKGFGQLVDELLLGVEKLGRAVARKAPEGGVLVKTP